ncbi:hypothetical protein Tco_1025982 [Tanacetum coccineum]
MLESKAYKTYYAFASGEKTPKLKYIRKKADSNTSLKQKPVETTKALNNKSCYQEEARHNSHITPRGSDEGTGTIPGVPDVPKYESERRRSDALTPVLENLRDEELVQNFFLFVSFTYKAKLLNLEIFLPPANNEIASLLDTIARHTTSVPEITSSFTITIPPPPPFFNPLPQQATPTPTPITSEATTLFTSLLDFSFSTLKRSRDDREKDQDPSAGSGRWTKRKKSRKEAELSRDSREPSHTVDDSGVQQDQEFDTVNNDEQPADKEVTKDDWFKKPERPPTPNSYWYKRKHVDSRPSQTWISQIDRAKEPRTLFDELMDTSFDFSAFVLNWLNIKDLTQEIRVGLAFELLKGTCKSLTELEYHLEECSKATTERHDKHNPEGKPYMFDLNKPLSLIQDHRFRQVIPQDFFINNDLEYLKEGDFPQLRLQDIEDMLLLLVQQKLTNLIIDERQNQRDLPRDISLDSVEVLRYEKRSKSENKGKVPTEMELILEQTQQGTSYEVSVSAEGVEELKRKVKIKGEKKEALLTLRQKPGQYICCQEL